MGLEVFFSSDMILVNRQTYSLLEYLGDIGGLTEFFYYSGWLLILPLTKFTLYSTLLSNLFDENTFERSRLSTVSLQDRIKSEFNSFRAFELRTGIIHYLCPDKDMKRKIKKSKKALMKELDLQKFIHRQRVQTTALMGLLSGGQQFFVHRLSKLYIKENLGTSSESSDNENLMLVDKDEHRYIDKLCWSESVTDKRFLNLFKVAKKESSAIVEQEL